MPWQNGYYYRAKKVNGRVIREYVGKGLHAELAAQQDDIDRTLRCMQAEALKAARARQRALDDEMDLLSDVVHLLARKALREAGFHQHKRGEWRRKRGNV